MMLGNQISSCPHVRFANLHGHWELVPLTDIYGPNCNIDFVHQFLQSSLGLFLTEISISPNTTHFRFPSYTLPPVLRKLCPSVKCRFPNPNYWLFQLRFPTRGWSLDVLLSIITFMFFVVISTILTISDRQKPFCRPQRPCFCLGRYRIWQPGMASLFLIRVRSQTIRLGQRFISTNVFACTTDRSDQRVYTLVLILTSVHHVIFILTLSSSGGHVIRSSLNLTRHNPPLWSYISGPWFPGWDDFCDVLGPYPCIDYCFVSYVSLSFSNFTNIILQGMSLFIAHFSKPGPSEWFSHIFSRVVHLKRLITPESCSLSNIKQQMYVSNRTSQRTSLPLQSGTLFSFTTGSRTFWFLAKAVSRDSSLPTFPLICDAPGDLVCERHRRARAFGSRLASSSTVPTLFTTQTVILMATV